MSLSHVVTPSRLNHLAFTQGLNPDQHDHIAQIASPKQWDAGATVFREGDHDSYLYIVEHGRVAIEISVPGRGRVTILTVGPGDVFGWSSLFFERPKTASARAVEPTGTLALEAKGLRTLCDADPSLGYMLTRRILDVVSLRLQATRMQLLDIYQH